MWNHPHNMTQRFPPLKSKLLSPAQEMHEGEDSSITTPDKREFNFSFDNMSQAQNSNSTKNEIAKQFSGQSTEDKNDKTNFKKESVMLEIKSMMIEEKI